MEDGEDDSRSRPHFQVTVPAGFNKPVARIKKWATWCCQDDLNRSDTLSSRGSRCSSTSFSFIRSVFARSLALSCLPFLNSKIKAIDSRRTRMHYNQYVSLCLVALVLGQAATLPQHPQYHPQQYQQQVRDERKFAEKPNAMKKVALDDLDDISTNQIQEGGSTGFSWSNMLSMLMQMLLGQTGGVAGPSKNEIDDGAPASPWANLLSVGLRVLTALLGGPQQPVDGIDKVDNQSSPMQGILTAVLGAFLGQGRDPDQVAVMAKNASEFISIVINLLDALKTSFSHRSLTARSMGRRDTVSEAAVASISMLKGYMRSVKSFNNVGRAEDEGQRGCAERALCEASAECVADAQGTSSIFCQLGSYATSYLLQRQSGVGFEALYEAGRRGRTGEDCRTLFVDCNAV